MLHKLGTAAPCSLSNGQCTWTDSAACLNNIYCVLQMSAWQRDPHYNWSAGSTGIHWICAFPYEPGSSYMSLTSSGTCTDAELQTDCIHRWCWLLL